MCPQCTATARSHRDPCAPAVRPMVLEALNVQTDVRAGGACAQAAGCLRSAARANTHQRIKDCLEQCNRQRV